MQHTESQRTISRRTRRTVGAAAVALALVAVVGCGGDETDAPVAEAPAQPTDEDAVVTVPAYGRVTPAQATELAGSGVTVIDVRTPEEYAEGHIEGAQLVDFYSDTFAEQIASLDPDDEYLVYCRSGNRSGQTIELMRQNGIEQVWDLQGGVVAGGLTLVP